MRMRIACWVTKTTDTHTHGICNIHSFSTTTKVPRTLLDITLYAHCLSCSLLKLQFAPVILYNSSCIQSVTKHRLRTNAAPYHFLSGLFSDVIGVHTVWRRRQMDVYKYEALVLYHHNRRKSKYTETSLSHYHFIHHKPHTEYSSIEPRPPW